MEHVSCMHSTYMQNVLFLGFATDLENVGGVEDDGVDARHLLEQHESQRYQQRLQVAAGEELEGVGLLLLALDVDLLDGGEFLGDVGALAPEPLQGLAGLLRLVLGYVPPWSLGYEEHQEKEAHRYDHAEERQPGPVEVHARHGTDEDT